MKITTQGEYGLRCLLKIAEAKGEAVSVEEIARTECLSSDYAEQLLLRLRRNGLIESVRGPGGGYILGRKPQAISLKDVILALENKPFETICTRLKKTDMCGSNSRNCRLREVWIKINFQTEAMLKRISLKTLIG